MACQNGGVSHNYTVILQRAEDGWWLANVPLLHATAQAHTRSSALKRAKSLIAFHRAIKTSSESYSPSKSQEGLELFSRCDKISLEQLSFRVGC